MKSHINAINLSQCNKTSYMLVFCGNFFALKRERPVCVPSPVTTRPFICAPWANLFSILQ